MIRRVISPLLLGLGILSFIGLAAPAAAQTVTLTATLTGGSENPPLNTGAFGTATVTVDVGARTVTYRVDAFNLPSGVTASHIHAGAIGTNGPTIVNFPVPTTASNDFAFSGTARDTDFTLRPDQGIRSAEDVIQAILGNNTYVNVHSAANPGGEIRGQLTIRP